VRTRRRRLAFVTVVVLAAPPLTAQRLAAQVPTTSSRWQPELRVDGFTGEPWAVHAGAGLGVRVSNNARLAVVGGIGPRSASDEDRGSGTRLSGRIEVLGRFVLDPYRESPRGPYAAAGLVQRLEAGLRPRTRLTAMLGVEGRPRAGWAPSLEAGFGGGVRVGLVFRRARAGGR
jgi:hypothetical protein